MFAKRIRLLSRAVLIAFVALLLRLTWLQTVCCRKYRGQSRRNAIKRIELTAFRGTIRDRRGVPIAVDKPCFDIVVPYRRLVDGWALCLRDVLDWRALCQGLSKAKRKAPHWPYRRAWQSLSEEVRAGVEQAAKGGWLAEGCKFDVVRALNKLLRRRDLYRDEDLEHVPVPGQARVLLERKRYRLSRNDVRKLNRLLLWATHPQTIAGPRPHEHCGPWRDEALAVAVDSSGQEIDTTVTRTIARVAALKEHLFRKAGRRFLIREEAVAHAVVHDVGLDAVARFRQHPERYENIDLRITTKRHYAQGDVAPHVVGYLQMVNAPELAEFGAEYDGLREKRYGSSDMIGRTGAERTYNRHLRGCRGERITMVSTEGRRVSQTILEKPPVPGHDVYLTIDMRIQEAAERALGHQRGAIVVLRPSTGEILALATSPRYDVRTFGSDYVRLASDTENAPLLDRSIRGFLPPGSVFKVVTAAAGLASHKISAWQTFTCPGYKRVAGVRLGCWARHGHGVMNLHEAMVHSCNVYFYEVACLLTEEQLGEAARQFGYGGKVAMDIPVERPNPFPDLPSVASRMNTSVGQGDLAATPLQVAAMINVIANDGVFVQPYLTRCIVSQVGDVISSGPDGTRREVVPKAAVQLVRKALIDVVRRGTAKGVGLDRFRVAAKTGTAQTSDDDRNHAWITGFAPYDGPKLSFSVVIESVPGHGGEVAGPVAARMLQEIVPMSLKTATAPGRRGPVPRGALRGTSPVSFVELERWFTATD